MKIYTKTGDQGDTGLFGGPRVPKDALRIETFGNVDELNSILGLARAEGLPADVNSLVEQIQNELFSLGAELATPDPAAHGTALIGPRQITVLEQAIDRFEAALQPLTQFILPGGTKPAAQLHLARTVCRQGRTPAGFPGARVVRADRQRPARVLKSPGRSAFCAGPGGECRSRQS